MTDPRAWPEPATAPARIGFGTWIRFVWPVLVLLAIMVVVVLSVSVMLSS